jgi:hypothetical protein
VENRGRGDGVRVGDGIGRVGVLMRGVDGRDPEFRDMFLIDSLEFLNVRLLSLG